MVREVAWWDALVQEFSQQQRLGMSAFCLSRGVRPSQFYYQQRKRERGAMSAAKPPEPTFREYLLPVDDVTQSPPVPSDRCGIRLHVGGAVIELPPGFSDEASLRAVLSCCR